MVVRRDGIARDNMGKPVATIAFALKAKPVHFT